MSEQNKNAKSAKQNRRQTLKRIGASSVALGAISQLPDQWMRPVVNGVILPSHAQTSAQLLTCSSTGAPDVFDVPGTYSIVVPAGITSLNVVVDGAAGGDGRSGGRGGDGDRGGEGFSGGIGAGGEAGYKSNNNSLPTTPGSMLTIIVGGHGVGGVPGGDALLNGETGSQVGPLGAGGASGAGQFSGNSAAQSGLSGEEGNVGINNNGENSSGGGGAGGGGGGGASGILSGNTLLIGANGGAGGGGGGGGGGGASNQSGGEIGGPGEGQNSGGGGAGAFDSETGLAVDGGNGGDGGDGGDGAEGGNEGVQGAADGDNGSIRIICN